MTARLGTFLHLAIKQLKAKDVWEKKWNPRNKRSRKYFTRVHKINARSSKAARMLTNEDVDTIRNYIIKHYPK